MPNKSISERLDDCEKIQGDQQTELVKHSERLRDLEVMKKSLKLLDSLREDFELVVQFSDVACRQIVLLASGGGPINIDPALRKKCRAFVKRLERVIEQPARPREEQLTVNKPKRRAKKR
jgi:hypothetical protein